MDSTLNDTNESAANDPVMWNNAEGRGHIPFGNHGFMDPCKLSQIRPGRRWRALQDILQYTGTINPGKRIIMAFGHGRKTKYIEENIDSWFLSDDRAGGFNKVAAGGMQKLLGKV